MRSPARRVATLRLLCRALRGDRARLQRQRVLGSNHPPDWSDVIALADELVVAPSLWCAVQDDADALPADAVEQLRDRYCANAIRNLRFRHQLNTAVAALNQAGIVPLLFKGALQLVDGTPASLGERWMADLDLAVVSGALVAGGTALREIGYEPAPGKPFLHPHEVPYDNHRTPGPIELHVELGSPPTPDVLPSTDAWAASSELRLGASRVRALSPTDQVLHNILHSAVQDLNHAVAGLSLRQLVALARLIKVHGTAVDWVLIRARMESHGLAPVLRDHLWLAHRLLGVALPDGVSDHRRARLHEARVMANFGLGWPADLHRNVRYAFGPSYLDSLYEHNNRPLKLAAARARHMLHLVRRDGQSVLRATLQRRI